MKVKKLLSSFLSLCMVIGMIAVPAFAEDEYVAKVGDKNYTDLNQALKETADKDSGDNTIEILTDINLKGVEWESVHVDGYNGAGVITIKGNNHTITGLNAPLIKSGFAGFSGVVIHDLTIANADINDTTTPGTGAFISAIDSMPKIELDNCHLLDSTVTGTRTGGLIGWTSGYDKVTDGPVKAYITISGCSVKGSTITGDAVGGINGHAGCNPWTFTKIENCEVSGNNIVSTKTDNWRAGAVIGTANVGEVTINNVKNEKNIFSNVHGIKYPEIQGTELVGRFVPDSTGKLVIDGVPFKAGANEAVVACKKVDKDTVVTDENATELKESIIAMPKEDQLNIPATKVEEIIEQTAASDNKPSSSTADVAGFAMEDEIEVSVTKTEDVNDKITEKIADADALVVDVEVTRNGNVQTETDAPVLVKIKTDKNISKVYHNHGTTVEELDFVQKDGYVMFTMNKFSQVALVVSGVAKIGDKEYATFKDAVADVKDNETIKLADGTFDLDTFGPDVSNRTFTIEGGENTVVTYVGVATSVVNFNLTIRNCEIEVGTVWCGSCLEGSGTYTYDNCTFKIADGKTPGSAIYALNYDSANPSTVNVKNCKFVGDFGEAAVVVQGTDNDIALNESTNTFINTNNKNVGIWNNNDNTTVNAQTENVRNMAKNPVAKIGNTEYSTLADALDKAQDGETIELISGDTPISAAGVVSGKTVTITGKAVFDWSKGYLFVGRTSDGTAAADGTLIFKKADIKSSSKEVTNQPYGFHISGEEKDEDSKQNGTLKIIDSTMEVDYLMNKHDVVIDNSDVTFYNAGFSVGGRPANETEDGKDATATAEFKNGSKVTIVDHNGMGIGSYGEKESAIGILTIDSTSELETTGNTLAIRKKGTLNCEGKILGRGITVEDGATVSITGGTYSFDPSEYVPAKKQVVKDDKEGLWIVADTWTLSANADKEEVKAGETVKVTVKADGTNYSGATWTLTYDKTKFKCTTPLTVGSNIKSFAEGEIVGYNYDSNAGDNYNEDTVLATYEFEALPQTSEVTDNFAITAGTVGTVGMSEASYPAANVAPADSVTITLKEFKTTVMVDGKAVNETSCNVSFDNAAHTISVITEPAAKVTYRVNGTETTEAPKFTNAGTYTVEYKVDVPAGYDQTAVDYKTFTLTIGAPVYDVEIAKYTDTSRLVLVYTNADNASFKYGKEYMYDVTAAYKKDNYEHVYGYAVKNVKLTDETFATDDFYKAQITFVQGGNPETVTYDYNVNCNGGVDISDVIYTAGIYRGTMQFNSMVKVLKADVNKDKAVDGDDVAAVKNKWILTPTENN